MSANKRAQRLHQVANGVTGESASRIEHHRTILYVIAALSGLTAIIYLLIGLNIVSVLEGDAGQLFGIPAAIAYAFGVLLLVCYKRRAVWVFGALFQIFVMHTYFNLASQRTPAYEFWGILIRIFQLIMLIGLIYLASRPQPAKS